MRLIGTPLLKSLLTLSWHSLMVLRYVPSPRFLTSFYFYRRQIMMYIVKATERRDVKMAIECLNELSNNISIMREQLLLILSKLAFYVLLICTLKYLLSKAPPECYIALILLIKYRVYWCTLLKWVLPISPNHYRASSKLNCSLFKI